MKASVRIILASFILCLSFVALAHGQILSVTATLTDPSATTWTNATCSIQSYNSQGGPSYYNGVAIPATPACSVNGSGVLSASLYNTSTLAPATNQYRFTINTGTTAPAQTFLTLVTTTNMSSTIQALLQNPIVLAGYGAIAYNDTEVSIPPFGWTYYNLTTPAWRQYGLSGWATVGGGAYDPTAVAITGGSINGTTIGNVTPAAGSFTTGTFSGLVSIPNGAFNIGGNPHLFFTNSGFQPYGAGTYFAGNEDNAWTQVSTGNMVLTSSTPTVETGHIGFGVTTVAASNCNQSGTLTTVTTCLAINISGTTHYIPVI